MKETEISVDEFNELKDVVTVSYDSQPDDVARTFCKVLEENGFDVEMFYNHKIPSQSYRIKRKSSFEVWGGAMYMEGETLLLKSLTEPDHNRFRSSDLERAPHIKGTLFGKVIVNNVIIFTFTENLEGKITKSAVDPNFDDVHIFVVAPGIFEFSTYGPTPTVIVSYEFYGV